jgi:hypothetical protein
MPELPIRLPGAVALRLDRQTEIMMRIASEFGSTPGEPQPNLRTRGGA